MTAYFTETLIRDLILFQIVTFIVLLSNIFLLHRARRHAAPASWPFVSILVPARDEAQNIERCVASLLRQDYPSFELVVLDDQSTDATPAILARLAQQSPRLTVLHGSFTPQGMGGKNYACARLADQARGDLLLFTDADTLHRTDALRQLVTVLCGENADLLSGFPRQALGSIGEKLLVPFFSWAVLCFTPLALAYHLRFPALSSAVGQVMLFRRAAYQHIGGHAALGAAINDDLLLARRVKAAGLRWRMAHLTDLVAARMYRGGGEALHGFSKNLFAAFDFRVLPFVFVYGWFIMMFWVPWGVIAAWALGYTPTLEPVRALACVGLSFLVWVIPYRELGVPVGLAVLYPFTILANEVVALRSMRLSIFGGLRWKDRPLQRPKWRWL